jgi:hypothetical protein
MSAWNHVIIEGYCLFSHASKKEWKCCDIDGKNKSVHKNTNYIPKTNRPAWCKKHNKMFVPEFRCLCHGDKTCPFFAYTNATKKDYETMMKAWRISNIL